MFDIEPLPYAENALDPIISARTIGFHYHEHHKGYLEKLRKLTDGRQEADASLEDLIRTAEDDDLFNNAAQVWNHSFYWKSMKPGGGGKPDGELLSVIQETFGSFEDLKRELAEAALTEFGSGWAWIVKDQYGRMRVQKSSDAGNPLRDDYRPLLALDVWEHAYYLDYQNERKRYVEGFIDHLIDWDFVAANLEAGD